MSGKIFFLLGLLFLNLFGKVEVNVDKKHVIKGDSVVYSITAEGIDVKFPKLKKIAGYDIESVSSSQSISIINGNFQTILTKSYVFTPLHSCTIPSYEVEVDSKKIKTKPISIKVMNDDKKNQDFKLDVFVPKEMIVGYPYVIKVKFYQKTSANFDSVQLVLPRNEDYELKQIGDEKDYYKDIYKVAEVKYIFVPKKQKTINFIVKLKIGFVKQEVDAFGFVNTRTRYRTLVSENNITSKKVYDGLVGDFKIAFTVDKKLVKAKKPVNGVLKIYGYGYLNNVGNIKLNIPKVTVYNNKIDINTTIKNNKVYSIYKRNFVILAEQNYTIPPISLSYYDIKKKKEVTISTKPVKIAVQNDVLPFQPVVKKKDKCKEKVQVVTRTKVEYKDRINYLYLLGAFIIGLILGLSWYFIKCRDKKVKFQLPKNLYSRLLPYADNPKIKEILNKLYNKKGLTKEDKEFLKEFLSENKRSI